MKTFFAAIFGFITFVAGLFTALSKWIGIVAGVLYAVGYSGGFFAAAIMGAFVGFLTYLVFLILGYLLTILFGILTSKFID